MPFRDTAIAQAWRRAHKLKLRDAARAERLANPRLRKNTSLHRELGIKTFVHRQAILNDPRQFKYDHVSRSWNHNHLFRENITLASA